MDLRSQPRWQTNEPVQVTVLGETETGFPGRITNFSSYGIGLLTDCPVAMGEAVKVEWGQTLLLGEVCHCKAVEKGFSVGLSLEHALYDTLQLAELAKRLLDEAPLLEVEVEADKKR
jgi:hypothetical protein